MSVEDIKSIWIASDDPAALDEVRAVAPAIFPNVDNSTVFWAAGGVPDGPAVSAVNTHTDNQVSKNTINSLFGDITHFGLFFFHPSMKNS